MDDACSIDSGKSTNREEVANKYKQTLLELENLKKRNDVLERMVEQGNLSIREVEGEETLAVESANVEASQKGPGIQENAKATLKEQGIPQAKNVFATWKDIEVLFFANGF